jgi:hypothetical protein
MESRGCLRELLPSRRTLWCISEQFSFGNTRLSKCLPQRNLSTRTRMFEMLLQTFWAKKTPCKKSADLHPRQGNLLHWNIVTGLSKTSLHFTK